MIDYRLRVRASDAVARAAGLPALEDGFPTAALTTRITAPQICDGCDRTMPAGHSALVRQGMEDSSLFCAPVCADGYHEVGRPTDFLQRMNWMLCPTDDDPDAEGAGYVWHKMTQADDPDAPGFMEQVASEGDASWSADLAHARDLATRTARMLQALLRARRSTADDRMTA